MSYFVVALKLPSKIWVVEGHNSTDAVLKAYRDYVDETEYEDAYCEAGSGNALAEELLADTFNCTEIHRAMVLEYVERRLDGDRNITINF